MNILRLAAKDSPKVTVTAPSEDLFFSELSQSIGTFITGGACAVTASGASANGCTLRHPEYQRIG